MKGTKGSKMATNSTKRKYFKDMIEIKTNEVYSLTKISNDTKYAPSTVCKSIVNTDSTQLYETIK